MTQLEDQTFAQAKIDNAGKLLFVGAKGESLRVWRVTDEVGDQPEHFVHCSLVRNTSDLPGITRSDKNLDIRSGCVFWRQLVDRTP